jgi:uncharacterized protein (DUF2252 family)
MIVVVTDQQTNVRAQSGEARAKGKDVRRRVSRSSQASWSPLPDRGDPIAILEEQNASRVRELVPVRMGRMVESPFAFFRGAAAVMASDLATTPVSGIEVQACGDAHLVNFGLYASPERTLLFDVNDFDETSRAPWEWDVKRLAASATVAARQNGCDDDSAAEITRAGVRSYRQRIAMLADMSPLDVFYARVDAETALSLSKTAGLVAQKQVAKAKKNTSARVLAKLTVTNSDGLPRLVDQPPILSHVEELQSEGIVRSFMERYRPTIRKDVQVLLENYRVVDVAVKVVGVGSVGTRCFIALLLDPNGAPLFLQIKEAEPSVLERYWKGTPDLQHGQRVVNGQLIMQAASDVFLGWAATEDGHHYYVRQFKDMKGSVDIPSMSPSALVEYLELCGWTLARAHAQSGRTDEIAGYLGSSEQFENAITAFAKSYADQNEVDHAHLVKAVDAGRIVAERGV